MPPVRRSTAKERHQEIMNLMMQGISRVNVRILRTLHRAHGLPQPMAPCRPLSPCLVAYEEASLIEEDNGGPISRYGVYNSWTPPPRWSEPSRVFRWAEGL